MKPEDYEAAVTLMKRALKMPCSYCGKPMEHGHPELHPTRDHIWPKAVRSMDAGRTGKLWCCAKCNFEKGDMMPSEWLALCKEYHESHCAIMKSDTPVVDPADASLEGNKETKRKVVYNSQFGGFSLSLEAVLLGRKLSGDPRWAGSTIEGEFYPDGSGPHRESGILEDTYHIKHDFCRHDPILVKVVETLGEKASGQLSDLQIKEVSGKYIVDGYDGFESVMTPDSYDWVE